MDKDNLQKIIKEIDTLISYYDDVRRRSKYDDLSDLEDPIQAEVRARLGSCIDRLAPHNSLYRKNIESHSSYQIGALRALRADYQAGFLAKIETMVQAELFSDFLEMAKYLLDNGYKDPAAVIIGSVLEEQLRVLSVKNNLPVILSGRPIKAESLNAELARADVVSKLDQKSITAWLDLRNKAAHGHFDDYTLDQVKLMHQGVQDFIARMS
ncbi:MAG: hypothetical protein PHW54_05630 [Candidatus Omnitrophica bacterium]|nr:hypothetical protein [Candidatus Omnitrophota bacterium]